VFSESLGLNIATETFNIGSKGILSVFFKETGLIDFIDSILPKERDHNVSHGESLLSLFMLGYSLSRRALYKVEEQMKEIPLNLFFSQNIVYYDFNDDVLGRSLDAIYKYGTDEFFVRVMNHLYNQMPDLIDLSRLHSDITNFTVHGQYKQSEDEPFKIVHGHPKNGCKKLKLFSLALITNTQGVPLFMNPLSGNCSDQIEIVATINKARQALMKNILKDKEPYYISDAAFYNKKTVSEFECYFITRVPETIKEAKILVASEVAMSTIEGDNRYSYHVKDSSYGDKEQHWFLFNSTEMAKKKEITFDRKCTKELEKANKAFKKLSKLPFDTEMAAEQSADKLIAKFPCLQFSKRGVVSKFAKLEKRGRPAIDEKRKLNFHFDGELELNADEIQRRKKFLGRFILTTNDLSLSAEDVLKFYKEQSQVEKGFRLLKSNDFRISDVLLKNDHRIQALCCFMALMLLIYSILELKINKGLKDKGLSITNHIKKEVDKVTFGDTLKRIELCTGVITFEKTNQLIQFDVSLPHDNSIPVLLEALGSKYLDFYTYSTGLHPIHELQWVYDSISSNKF
jgi:transposase